MSMSWSGTPGTGAGRSNHDDNDDCRDGDSDGAEPPGLGTVGNDAVSRPPRGPDAVVSNRSGVGGRSVIEFIVGQCWDSDDAYAWADHWDPPAWVTCPDTFFDWVCLMWGGS